MSADSRPAAGAYFHAPDVHERASRRILLITGAFPPCAEVGAARWEAFSHFLATAGWGLDVIMDDPATLDVVDWSRVELLPADVRIAGVARRSPTWLRGFVWAKRLLKGQGGGGADSVAPASHSVRSAAETTAPPGLRERLIAEGVIRSGERWVRDVGAAARAIVASGHRVVVSSGPPHIAHVAAAYVAHAAGLPHVMDMRDPWTTATSTDGDGARLAQQDGERHEAATLRGAARIITNTREASDRLVQRFPELAGRVIDIPNGSDLPPLRAADAPVLARFVIAHSGTLYLDRDPRPLLRAAARLRQAHQLAAADFGVVFMGATAVIDDRPLESWAEELQLADVMEVRPLGSREEARALLRESAVGVAFQGASLTQVPAKVFEYAAFPLWLFALVGRESATAALLEGTPAVVLDIDDEEGIYSALEGAWRQFRATGRPDPAGIDGRFSRERQAGRLVALLDEVGAIDRPPEALPAPHGPQ